MRGGRRLSAAIRQVTCQSVVQISWMVRATRGWFFGEFGCELLTVQTKQRAAVFQNTAARFQFNSGENNEKMISSG
jgi:hypothetical protein